ncbi:hypothetical protein ACSX1A_07150 [Pontibacter sp. MBLB2868]|uniref:hypothetical protein n=1 Tax=Pontibacter sp. MBLB2868 TaxID=3451555 RepID=UPI003F75162D
MALSLNYKFLLLACLISALASAVLNTVVVNIVFSGYKLIPVWGQQSVASYLFTSSIITNFILVWVVTKSTRKALSAKHILPLHWHLKSQTLVDRLPARTAMRSFILAVASCLMTAYTLYLLGLKGFNAFYRSEFYTFNLVYFSIQSAAIAVMAIYRAMGDNVMEQYNLQ